MICRIQGVLESIDEGRARLTPVGAGLSYEVLLPAFAAAKLGGAIDTEITLHTHQFFEASGQGTNMTPRLAGFLTPDHRAFYELFTTVKGIGPRKALRALALDPAHLAAAIAERDVTTLQTLPEIGKRMAETIVATLHGKVDRFLAGQPTGRDAGEAGEPADAPPPPGAASREALEVLVQLGEARPQAARWIDQVLTKHPGLDDPQQIITEALRLKAS